jgi:hypothetical protein
MSNLTLNLDKKAENNLNELKKHYGSGSKAEVIRKALALLQIAAALEDQKGQLIAKKTDKNGIEQTVEIILG